jgi:hypothetical protein
MYDKVPEQTNSYQKCAGNIQKHERVPNHATHKLCLKNIARARRQTATAFLTARPARGDLVNRSTFGKNRFIMQFVGQMFVD